jgi:hypothetical protein
MRRHLSRILLAAAALAAAACTSPTGPKPSADQITIGPHAQITIGPHADGASATNP